MRSFPEACRAWTVLIATLIDQLRAAAASTYAITNVTPPQRRWSIVTGKIARAATVNIPTANESVRPKLRTRV